MPGGTLRGSDQGGAPSEHFPCPISPRSLHGSQAGSSSFRGPLQAMLVLGAQEGSRENRERQAGGALQDQRSRGRLPRPLKPRKPVGLPGQVPHPLRTETCRGPICSVEPKPQPTRPLRAFSSHVGLKHRSYPLPKPRPCLSPAPQNQGLFRLFFFLLFFTIVVLFYPPFVVSSIFSYSF